MRNISDLIEFENENSNLDFKAIQYKRETNEAFLKDIMSLANSMSRDDKYIIIGVKHKTNGDRDLLGITEDFVDDATYQQLVDANIEPHINFNYFPYEHNGKRFGIFQIKECVDPPYMMKKDYGNLKSGDSYIRKGSFQKRLTRKDIDIHQNILKNKDISSDVYISLKEDEIIYDLKFEKYKILFPSEVARKKIEEIIKHKEQELKDNPYSINRLFQPSFSPIFGSSYESRDIPTLRSNLEKISKSYKEKDNYYLNEEIAQKLNIYIHNNSTEFLEDTSVEILIPKSDKYIIRDSIFSKPYSTHPLIKTSPRVASWSELNYPNVEIKEDYYKITEEIGNVKHKLPTEGLKVPLRLVILDQNDNLSIEMDVKIFAKNIEKPIQKKLKINL